MSLREFYKEQLEEEFPPAFLICEYQDEYRTFATADIDQIADQYEYVGFVEDTSAITGKDYSFPIIQDKDTQ